MGLGRAVFTGLFTCIGSFLFGYDSGIITSTIAQTNFIKVFKNPSPASQGGIVSAYTGGAVVGCVVVYYIGDRLGRKRSIFIGAWTAILGCALQAGAVNIPMLIVGRLITGIAVGIMSTINPVYCAEVAPPAWRGTIAGFQQLMVSFGFLFAQWIGYGCSFANDSFQWRFPLAFQLIPALVLGIGIPFQLESPRWLIMQDRQSEAVVVLRKLHFNGHNENFLNLEYCEIRDAIAAEQALSVRSWKQMISTGPWRRRLYLACGLQLSSQLSGVNVINYYGPRIYSALNFGLQESLLIIGINGALSVCETALGFVVVDKIGRVKPLIVGAFGMAFALLVEAVLASTIDANPTPSSNQNALRASVAMNSVFSVFFTPVGIIGWVYPSEIFPTELRQRGNVASTLTNWVFNLILAQVSPIALAGIGIKYFYCFFCFNFIAGICFWVFYPETKGYTLEEIDEVFGDQKVPHALQEPEAAARVMAKDFDKVTRGEMQHVEQKYPNSESLEK